MATATNRYAERRRNLLLKCERHDAGDPDVKAIVILPADLEWVEQEGLIADGRLTVRGRMAAHAVKCGLAVPDLGI